MAKAILAGYNLDNNIIEDLKKNSLGKLEKKIDLKAITPETISAAYARISRSPAPVPQLREQSIKEVEKARKSNEAIIFELGHSSVAEHAYFNFDILGISRLGVEFLERFRLASFTEKSQRYITLKGDYVTPSEIKDLRLNDSFNDLIEKQNKAYSYLYEKLQPYFKKKYPEMLKLKNGLRTLEGWAKEDARYVLSLATEAQLGMSVNARTLEYMIASSQSHPLKEIQDLGNQLFNLVKEIAPSLIKYPKPTIFLQHMENIYASPVKQDLESEEIFSTIQLLNENEINEEEIFKALGFSIDQNEFCENKNIDKYKNEIIQLFRSMQLWDTPPRAFEWVDFKFEIVLSSSAFAQLKRHRMSTQLMQPYNINLGVTIPPSIKAIKEEAYFKNTLAETEKLYLEIINKNRITAPYILTNAHRRRVIVKMNMREVYHFVRLRADEHAQWDIRIIAQNMEKLIRNKFPFASLLLSGKDKFSETFKQLEKFSNEN